MKLACDKRGQIELYVAVAAILYLCKNYSQIRSVAVPSQTILAKRNGNILGNCLTVSSIGFDPPQIFPLAFRGSLKTAHKCLLVKAAFQN